MRRVPLTRPTAAEMDRDALGPVAAGSLVVVVVTSLASATLEHGLDLPVVYADAVTNGGMALVLVGVLLLFEWLSYEVYRRKGLLWIGADAALVFLAAVVVTVAVVSGFEIAGLGDLGGEVAGVAVDVVGVLGGVAAFVAAVVLFYARNRDCYRPPGPRRRVSR
jgi:hypothetical protein